MDDKMLLKVASFIKNRYDSHKDTKSLLSKEDHNYISPYLDKIQLSKEEWDFVKKSRQRIRTKRIVFLGTGFVITAVFFFLFIWAEYYRRDALYHQRQDKKNSEKLLAQKDSIDNVNHKFELAEAERLRFADSLAVNGIKLSDAERALMAKNEELEKSRDTLEILLKTERKLKKELADALTVEKKLAKEATDAKDALQKLNNQLAAVNKQLEEAEKKAQSRALSARALFVLRQNNDMKLAAQLASESYLLDKSNKEACGVLAELSGKGADYFQKYAPAKTYEDMIEALKKNYGTLDTKDKYKYLRGMPTEILQQVPQRGGR